jgi:hypothetical protein
MLEVLGTRAPGNREFRHSGTFDGARLTVTYVVDSREHESRRSHQLGALTDEFLLAGLISLPPDDLTVIDSRFIKAFRRSAMSEIATVLRDPDGEFWGRARLRVPLEVIEIEIVSARWRHACATAHRWVGYGPRVVNLSEAIEPFELAEASHYGIGVVGNDGVRVLEPAAYSPQRWSSSRWRLAELIYAQYLELES